MRPHSFFFHPIINSSTTREPVKGFALLRFATALRVTEPRLRAVRELIGTRNDLLRLRRGIEQGMIEKRKEEKGLGRGQLQDRA
jgi:hypothetical protein